MSVRVVVTARGEANLKRALVEAVRGGKLRHKQRATHPGYITLDWGPPDLVAEVHEVKSREAMLLGGFVGRLHARFGKQVESVTMRFG